MTYFHVVTTVPYGDNVKTVAANNAKDSIKVHLRGRHILGTEPFKTHLEVYERLDGDPYYNASLTEMERRFVKKIRQERKMLASCDVTIIPQKIIVEDA